MAKLLIGIAALLLAGGSAAAASFDCKQAKTKVEQLICANPELSKADDELNRQYQAACLASKKDLKLLRQVQSKWLHERRDDCADVPCLLAVYEQRTAELRATARPSGWTGRYLQVDGVNSVDVLEIAAGVLRFELGAFWKSSGGSTHIGQLCGQLKLQGDTGRYKDPDCELEWTFRKGGTLRITQQGRCGFGANVTATATYKRIQTAAPVISACILEG